MKIFKGTLCLSAVLAVIVGIVYGYVNNIVVLTSAAGEGVGMIAGRVAGIFVAPLGVLLGYF